MDNPFPANGIAAQQPANRRPSVARFRATSVEAENHAIADRVAQTMKDQELADRRDYLTATEALANVNSQIEHHAEEIRDRNAYLQEHPGDEENAPEVVTPAAPAGALARARTRLNEATNNLKLIQEALKNHRDLMEQETRIERNEVRKESASTRKTPTDLPTFTEDAKENSIDTATEFLETCIAKLRRDEIPIHRWATIINAQLSTPDRKWMLRNTEEVVLNNRAHYNEETEENVTLDYELFKDQYIKVFFQKFVTPVIEDYKHQELLEADMYHWKMDARTYCNWFQTTIDELDIKDDDRSVIAIFRRGLLTRIQDHLAGVTLQRKKPFTSLEEIMKEAEEYELLYQQSHSKAMKKRTRNPSPDRRPAKKNSYGHGKKQHPPASKPKTDHSNKNFCRLCKREGKEEVWSEDHMVKEHNWEKKSPEMSKYRGKPSSHPVITTRLLKRNLPRNSTP
jgi:hypothetical protein